MPVKVGDASVLAALAFGESRADEAATLLSGADLYAPELLSYSGLPIDVQDIHNERTRPAHRQE